MKCIQISKVANIFTLHQKIIEHFCFLWAILKNFLWKFSSYIMLYTVKIKCSYIIKLLFLLKFVLPSATLSLKESIRLGQTNFFFFMYFGTPCTCCNQHATTPFTLQTNAHGGWGCSRPTRVNKLEMQTPICQQKRRTLSLSFFPALPLSLFSVPADYWWKGSAFVSRRAPSPTVGTVV